MASSLYKAQVDALCNFCENQNSVQWKCLECKDLMCTVCKHSHEKFSATKSHRIVSIKDLSEELLRAGSSVITCLVHNESCGLFCTNCNTYMCCKCLVKTHKGHLFEDLADFRESLKGRIKSIFNKIQRKKDLYEKFNDEAPADKQRTQNELEDRKQKLIESIEKKYHSLTNELNKFYEETEKQVEVVYKTDKLLELTTKESFLEEIMRTNDVIEHVTRISEIERDVEALLLNIPELKHVHFQTGDMTEEDMAREFGYLSSKTQSTSNIDIDSMEKLDVVKTVNTEIKDVSAICLNNNDTTWAFSVNDDRISLLDNRNLSGRPINQISIASNNCCVSDNDLLVCDVQYMSIKSISLNGSVKTLKDMTPLIPNCIYVTSSKDMIVGAVDNINYDVDEKSKRVIFKMTMAGTLEQELEYDTRGIRLFTLPYRCTVSEQNNDLLVIDRTEELTSRVICFLENGDVKFRYFGDLSLKLPYCFHPVACLFANNGLIIISDISNSSLHILNEEGRLMKYMSLEDIGIVCPQSIAIDKCGRLWIGSYPGNDSNAKIYITHFK